MSTILQQRLNLLSDDAHRAYLTQGRRGIERETLRVDARGDLAQTPHPVALGSALTHQTITTDYAEALVEFITPAEHDIADALVQLDASHRFFYQHAGNELLWSQSMPCRLPDESEIPIAWYGTSHIGMLKHVYRRGLALRYGKTMQCIAGIHYNFSIAEEIWPILQAAEGNTDLAVTYQSESYIATIRNFHRYSWLLMFLFGASPALSAGFLRGRPHQLQTLNDDTLYLPYATSLRMSDLGYQNNAQAELAPSYDDLANYMESLTRAVRQPWPPYVELGTKRAGEWVQINTNVLQIENEFYSTIRPKRVITTGERPIEALCARGVQYIEVRCLDIDPFEPLGITLEAGRFMDAFLLFCALDHSPLISEAEARDNTRNFAKVVKEGRRPSLQLQRKGQAIDLKDWGLELLSQIEATACLLDHDRTEPDHQAALASQRAKLHDSSLTPSARVLAALSQHGNSFVEFSLAQSRLHAKGFRARPLTAAEHAEFTQMAQASLVEQARLEQQQTGDFDDFIEAYRVRAMTPTCCD